MDTVLHVMVVWNRDYTNIIARSANETVLSTNSSGKLHKKNNFDMMEVDFT